MLIQEFQEKCKRTAQLDMNSQFIEVLKEIRMV